MKFIIQFAICAIVFLLIFLLITWLLRVAGYKVSAMNRIPYSASWALLVASIIVIVNVIDFVDSTYKTSGRVIEFIEYQPIVQFTAADGQEYQLISRLGTYPPTYSLGESVTIQYDPDNPQKAEIKSLGTTISLFVPSIVYLFLGLLLFYVIGEGPSITSLMWQISRNRSLLGTLKWLKTLERNYTFGKLDNKKGCFIDLKNTKVHDEDLARLKNVRKLVYLNLEKTHVTDSGLNQLKKFPDLEFLNLSKTSITNQGLGKISGHAKLRWLGLIGTTVDDSGLFHLHNLNNLEYLLVKETAVTKEGKKEQKKQIPELKFYKKSWKKLVEKNQD